MVVIRTGRSATCRFEYGVFGAWVKPSSAGCQGNQIILMAFFLDIHDEQYRCRMMEMRWAQAGKRMRAKQGAEAGEGSVE